MYIAIILLLFNLLMVYLYYSNKVYSNNDYSKEACRLNKLKIKYLIRFINIGYILIFAINLIILSVAVNITYIADKLPKFLFLSINMLIYIIFEISTKTNKKRFKIIDKKIMDSKMYLLIISFYVTYLIDKTLYKFTTISNINEYDFILNYYTVLKIIISIIIMTSLLFIVKLVVNNKDKCSYVYDNDSYLEDVRFYNKIDLKNFFNYFLFAMAYVVFFYINIPYVYIFYLVLLLILIIAILKKIKKISYESDRLYKTVTIVKEKPGILYAFNFTRDLLKLKKLCSFTVIFAISIITYYLIGESSFVFIAFTMWVLLLYIFTEDKVYLIRYISSLNEEFIDDNKYSINEIKNINYIHNIKLFGINLYKVIVKDSINYESNIILYDPEYRIEEINIRINKDNIDDYIMIERYLYLEE